MTRRKCELLARGYLGMCSAEEEREDETRQDSHPSNRHAAACAGMAGDFFLHDRESRRGRLRWQCKKEEGEEKTIRPNAESGSHILLI